MTGERLPPEFQLIAEIFAPLAAGTPGAFGLTDDAAAIEPAPGRRLIVTVDAIVEGIHFLSDDPPADVARKLLRVNLSDLAAMGARPIGYVMATVLPFDLERAWLEGFAAGLADDQKRFGVGLYGGDTASTPGPMTLSLTAFGDAEPGRELRRSGARPGDRIWVSGTIGDGALGLKALRGQLKGVGADGLAYLAGRYRVPTPRVELGLGLVGLANSAIDISDGLAADLGHVCETSGVRGVVEAVRVPLSEAARQALAAEPGLRADVLGGGDDYELLFTAPSAAADRIAGLGRSLGLPLTEIGRIEAGAGVTILDEAGRPIVPEKPGFRHF
ncbi:MAG TPA: thiamine-phosphate kinase [Alphaproteobacteria bacterium]|nr:thiamine-phosphate kinase [Alphaproteobacteria bacterium]